MHTSSTTMIVAHQDHSMTAEQAVSSPSVCVSSLTASTGKGGADLEITSVDVLLGRGKRIMNHPGNKRFKKLVETYKNGYDKLEKAEKTRLSREIVNSVRKHGGRFLAMNPKTNMYEDAGDYIAREKVSHILREKPRQTKPKRKRSIKTTKSSKNQSNVDIVGRTVLEQLLNNQKKIFNELSASHSTSITRAMEESPEEDDLVEDCLSSEFFFDLERIACDEIVLSQEEINSLASDDFLIEVAV